MDHLRKQIRHALVALLTDANTDVGDHVYTGRALPLDDGELPAIEVGVGLAEGRRDGGRIDSDEASDPTRLLDRRPVLVVAVTVKRNDGYLDAIDGIYADVEKTIAEDNTLGGLCAYIAPAGEPGVYVAKEGERTVARAEMPFEIRYITAFNAPDAPA